MIDTDPAVFAVSSGEADKGVPICSVEPVRSIEVGNVCEEVIEILADATVFVLLL